MVRFAVWRECAVCGTVFYKVGNQCPDCGEWDTVEISNERASSLIEQEEELARDRMLASQELEDFEGLQWDDMEYI